MQWAGGTALPEATGDVLQESSWRGRTVWWQSGKCGEPNAAPAAAATPPENRKWRRYELLFSWFPPYSVPIGSRITFWWIRAHLLCDS